MTKLLNGKLIAKKIKEKLKEEIKSFTKKGKRPPKLEIILVGNNPASNIYVQNKERAGKKIGLEVTLHRLEENIKERKLNRLVAELNQNPSVDGIIVQLPLPSHINTQKVISQIWPTKDVDGFHPENLGRLLAGEPFIIPATARGILHLLEETKIPIQGKDVIIIGRSIIVGRPLASLLLIKHATVTVCHTKTKDLKTKINNADIVIAAAGKANLIPGEWIKEKAIVIDVGTNKTEEGKLVGDIHFESASQRASYITPVPGGVGPMTVAMLLQNTFDVYKNISMA
jgi:methylenetetrahydrofolate dehydrogenase (NADP+)/methenyltetrahydrofolate cyclohydrolase